ncbi:hypothetical protein ACS0PU_006926 [Formica fusca]
MKTEWHELINVSPCCRHERKIITIIIDLPTQPVGLSPRGEGHRLTSLEKGGKRKREKRVKRTSRPGIFSPSLPLASKPATKDSGLRGRDGSLYVLSASLIYVHQFRARHPRVRSVVENFNARLSILDHSFPRSVLNATSW